MSFQSRILPIDESGGFLVATFHKTPVYRHREIEEAWFAVGLADRPDELREVAELLTSPLGPDLEDAVSAEEWAANAQDAAGRREERAHRHKHLEGARESRYQAQLARGESRRIPSVLLTARDGIVVAALGNSQHPSGVLLRIIDVRRSAIVAEVSPSQRTPFLLNWPMAVSHDGVTVAFKGFGRVHLLRLDKEAGELKPLCRMAGDFDSVHACSGGWLLVGEEKVVVADPAGKVIRSMPLPDDVRGWTAGATPDGRYVALATTTNSVWLLDVEGGQARTFQPNRGARRGIDCELALSDCGRWMASRAGTQVSVTDLQSGQSWPAARQPDRCVIKRVGDHEFEDKVHESVAFVGARLLVTGQRKVGALDVEANRAQAYVSEQGRPGARERLVVPAKASFGQLMGAAGLEAASASISPHFSPGANIKTRPLGKNGWAPAGAPKSPALGASRFGGWPDLPRDAPWPQWKGRPLGFVGQVNLAEAHAAESSLKLPKTGLLSFFLAAGEEVDEIDGTARYLFQYSFRDLMFEEAELLDAWRVIFTPDTAALERRAYDGQPLPPTATPRSLKFSKGALSLPDEAAAAYDALPLGPEDRDRYNELIEVIAPPEEGLLATLSTHQLMGYPTHPAVFPAFGSELEAECGSRGLDPAKLRPDAPGMAGIRENALRWGLLLQVATDFEAGFDWGSRPLFFYAPREAMEKGDFSRIWMTW